MMNNHRTTHLRTGMEVKRMGYILYLLLCGFSGFVMAKADIKVKNWKYWAILCCVIGAYFCGKYI